jgi:hypothetical protein
MSPPRALMSRRPGDQFWNLELNETFFKEDSMLRTHIRWLAIPLLATALLAGCSDDDDSSGPRATSPETVTPHAPVAGQPWTTITITEQRTASNTTCNTAVFRLHADRTWSEDRCGVTRSGTLAQEDFDDVDERADDIAESNLSGQLQCQNVSSGSASGRRNRARVDGAERLHQAPHARDGRARLRRFRRRRLWQRRATQKRRRGRGSGHQV